MFWYRKKTKCEGSEVFFLEDHVDLFDYTDFSFGVVVLKTFQVVGSQGDRKPLTALAPGSSSESIKQRQGLSTENMAPHPNNAAFERVFHKIPLDSSI